MGAGTVCQRRSSTNGLTAAKATEIFALIEFFGGYGFNKSHSTAYALVAYQTAYLKAHYPTEFMAALLSSEIDGAERDKLVEHIEDCRRMGIEVRPPDINQGGVEFEVAAEGAIHFALSAIKGVGIKAVEAIVAARQKKGPFRGLDDLFERVPLGVVGLACVEALIKAGACDSLGGHRGQWLAILPRAAQAGQAVQEDRRRGQRGTLRVLVRRARQRFQHRPGAHGPPRLPATAWPRSVCPRSLNSPTPNGWLTRREFWASTCPATR